MAAVEERGLRQIGECATQVDVVISGVGGAVLPRVGEQAEVPFEFGPQRRTVGRPQPAGADAGEGGEHGVVQVGAGGGQAALPDPTGILGAPPGQQAGDQRAHLP